MKILATVLVLAVGCGSKTDEPKPTEKSDTVASDDDYVKRGIDMVGKLAETFKADGTNCDKLADDLDKLQNDPRGAALDAYEKAHPDVKKKLEAAVKDRIEEIGKLGGAAMTACKDNKKLLDVMAKF